MMKQVITTLTIIFWLIGHQSNGQDFAPKGAKWYFGEGFAFTGDISYLYIESIGDTIIKGKNCSTLVNNGGLYCTFYHKKDYVYYEDSIAYVYIPEIDSFQILFNMKAKKNDSWDIIFKAQQVFGTDTLKVLVDSVSFVTINSQVLKRLHVKYKPLIDDFQNHSYRSTIYERMGDRNYLFNLHPLIGIFCDANYSKGLRCYEDPEFGFYTTNGNIECDYTNMVSETDDKVNSVKIDIYPNPTIDWISIESNVSGELLVRILDLYGKEILNTTLTRARRIDMSTFDRGFYMMNIYQFNNLIESKKVIVL